MAGGWTRDGAVQEQIDASVADAVKRARSTLTGGTSRTECEDCDEPIPEGRRKAIPGVRRCVPCQEAHDRSERATSGYNRRGSKDSQLK